MNNVFILVLRRMRAPLILLIEAYVIAVVGLTLIPGTDGAGQTYQLSLFEAFYVVSYTATTIGFGEIPFPFSPPQRLWMIFTIYLTVIAWVYAIGQILALLQEKALREALAQSRFRREVARLREPFYLICGYGETGAYLVEALTEKGIQVVVLDASNERITLLELQDLKLSVPTLCADACLADNLLLGGVRHTCCVGVVVITNDDHTNLAIAAAVKLLCPKLALICRVHNKETADSMHAFGVDRVIDPFASFGSELEQRLHALGACLLRDWLTSPPGTLLRPLPYPPTGDWIVCGFGRFGQSVDRALGREQNRITVVEPNPELNDNRYPFVQGKGTEAQTLREAGVTSAVGIIAGTTDDVSNLTIAMTARRLNPRLFVVLRENHTRNRLLFDAFQAEITMRPADTIAQECLEHLLAPLLARFIVLASAHGNPWVNSLIARLVGELGEEAPETWEADVRDAPAALAWLQAGQPLQLGDLLADARRDGEAAAALLLAEAAEETLLPGDSTRLTPDSRILFCGTPRARSRLALSLQNLKALAQIHPDKRSIAAS